MSYVLRFFDWCQALILKDQASATIILILALIVLWRGLRAYAGYIVRCDAPPAPKPARDHTPNLIEAIRRLDERLTNTEQVIAGSTSRVNGLPDPSNMRPGTILVWNGRSWVGQLLPRPADPPANNRQPAKPTRVRGKKAAAAPAQADRPQTAWDRIQEDEDGG